jgi:Uma2 family endonuclease
MTAYPQPMRLRFTVDEYYKMSETGILKFSRRAEIIDGELIEKMSIGDFHAAVVNFLTKFFVKNVSDEILVSVQNPLRLSDYHEPEPDFVLADLTKYDGKRHPRPAEVLVVVEVSDTTLDYDRKTKIPLYAEAAIPEVWLVNLQNETIQIHTDPQEGTFGLVKIYRRGDSLKSEKIAGLQIEVDKIFG